MDPNPNTLRGYARTLARSLESAEEVSPGIIEMTTDLRDEVVAHLRDLGKRDEEYVEALRRRIEENEKILLPREGEPRDA